MTCSFSETDVMLTDSMKRRKIMCEREANKEAERVRGSLLSAVSSRDRKMWRRKRVINLSGDRFRPGDLLLLILLRSQGEKM